jgi:hypothetical protein
MVRSVAVFVVGSVFVVHDESNVMPKMRARAEDSNLFIIVSLRIQFKLREI